MQLEFTEVVKTKYRDRFVIYRNDGVISGSIREYGEYQQVELDVLLQTINEHSVVYDVGSNIGYHASAFASVSKQVYCFEPNPTHFKMLRMNLQEEPRCNLINAAVSNTNGKILVEEFDMALFGNYGMARVGSMTGTEVPMVTIDSLVNAGKLPLPNLIKIDVEGHELGVFQGAYETIKTARPWIYFEAQETENLPEIYELLTGLDYKLGWCVVRNFNPGNFNNNPTNIFGADTIFSIIAFQPTQMTSWELPVLGPTDSWQLLLDRFNHK